MMRDFSIYRNPDGMYDATSFLNIVNVDSKVKVHLGEFLRLRSTRDLILSIARKEGLEINSKKIIRSTYGRTAITYMHPILFVELLFFIKADLKYALIKLTLNPNSKYLYEQIKERK